MIQSDLIKFENWIKCADSTVPFIGRKCTRKLLHLKFNLQFIRHNSFLLLCCCIAVCCLLPLCCCIKKEGLLQSWNCSIVHIKAKRQGRIVLHRRLIVSCLHSEFRGFLISEIGHLGLLCMASSIHPFKAPKGSKALFRWGYFQAWNARQFLKGNIWKCDEHLRESMQTLRYHGNFVQSNALFCSHDTWGLESSRAAVKGTKPKIQDRRVHLLHRSSPKFTCNGSLQRAVSIFTAVCTKSRQYRVWEHKESCAVGGVLLHSWEMLLPCSFPGNTTRRPSADD